MTSPNFPTAPLRLQPTALNNQRYSVTMATEQFYGVTPPISVTLPTESEKRASDALIEELRRQKTFESPSETQKRQGSTISVQ